MSTAVWVQDGSGSWEDAANWSTDAVPESGDTAVLDGSDAYNVFTSGENVGDLEIENSNVDLQIQKDATFFFGGLENFGTITVGDGARFTGGATGETWVNQGVINIESNANFSFESSITTRQIGNINNLGTLFFANSLDNSNASFDLDTLGIVSFFASIEGGTVISNDTNYQVQELVLDDVQWQGTLTNTDGGFAGGLLIENGLSLTGAGGVGPGTLVAVGGPTANGLSLDGSFALDTMSVTLSTNMQLTTGSNITFGAGFVLDAGNGFLNAGPQALIQGQGTVTNDGMLVASTDTHEGPINAFRITPLSFTNNGVIEATNKGSVFLSRPNGGPGLRNNGTIAANGGAVFIHTPLAGTGLVALEDNGVVRVDAGVDANQQFYFVQGQGIGHLKLADPQDFAAKIHGFVQFDDINLLGIAASSPTFANGTLDVQTSTGAVALRFAGNYVSSDFTLTSDSHGGTVIKTDVMAQAAADIAGLPALAAPTPAPTPVAPVAANDAFAVTSPGQAIVGLLHAAG